MISIITSLLVIFFVFFSNAIYAKTYGASICKTPEFFCYTIKSKDTFLNRLLKDPTQRDIIMRINRINTSFYPGMVIAIPKDFTHLTALDVAPFPKQVNPPGEKYIYVSLKDLAFGAYNANGTLEYWGPVSGGRGYCPDIHRSCHTKAGTFFIYRKENRYCVSTKFPVGRGGAPMPYCMFFNGGFALHGSHEVPGYNASHGCIRMFVNDAKWLNEEFVGDRQDIRVIISN